MLKAICYLLCSFIEYLIGKLKQFQPADAALPAVNIVLVGPKGSGKSSLINSLLTSISTSLQLYAPSGGLESVTGTKDIIRTPLWRYYYFRNFSLTFWYTVSMDL